MGIIGRRHLSNPIIMRHWVHIRSDYSISSSINAVSSRNISIIYNSCSSSTLAQTSTNSISSDSCGSAGSNYYSSDIYNHCNSITLTGTSTVTAAAVTAVATAIATAATMAVTAAATPSTCVSCLFPLVNHLGPPGPWCAVYTASYFHQARQLQRFRLVTGSIMARRKMGNRDSGVDRKWGRHALLSSIMRGESVPEGRNRCPGAVHAHQNRARSL